MKSMLLTFSILLSNTSFADCANLSGEYKFEKSCEAGDDRNSAIIPSGLNINGINIGDTIKINQVSCDRIDIDYIRPRHWDISTSYDSTDDGVKIFTNNERMKIILSKFELLDIFTANIRLSMKSENELELDLFSAKRTLYSAMFKKESSNICTFRKVK